MLNNIYVLNGIRFILLVLAQVLVFNNMNFMGTINPMIYIIFLYWYPIRENVAVFLIISFLLGFVIDLFSDTMAIHSAAILTIAFVRPVLMRFCFGANFEFQGFTFKNTTRVQRMTFLGLLIGFHHLIFFSLELLSFSHFLLILEKVLFTGIATFIISLLLSSLFAKETE
ncbi:rod shape-determining protein MreD [uncultured Croceitalea sp.]|uniref:rod shape-determining protein MreD n=1 Tax=uncultured Croceitalea sp. TaxID=1798908 RepID=UPI00374E78D2